MLKNKKKMSRKWSIKYKKVLIVIIQRDFHKNNIVNMEGDRIPKKNDK